MKCKKCGNELKYNAELSNDPTFEGYGVSWFYCDQCDTNIENEECLDCGYYGMYCDGISQSCENGNLFDKLYISI